MDSPDSSCTNQSETMSELERAYERNWTPELNPEEKAQRIHDNPPTTAYPPIVITGEARHNHVGMWKDLISQTKFVYGYHQEYDVITERTAHRDDDYLDGALGRLYTDLTHQVGMIMARKKVSSVIIKHEIVINAIDMDKDDRANWGGDQFDARYMTFFYN
ncbi:hypothetical protein Ptr902_10126 [Pyrenophora tritici-repentis]|uniref:Uncharacterized protein n=2 Tax=Pyrenophora tritici-repentis TaxID=45151 RepID=B2W8Z1_PYRTR|nr:uncharacterized protein PTRG_06449 [Pyrenophora tritici-repentis Pt-1C-BFP]KAI0625194.1 hypothetical protein TUN199_02791 [Pyrenophora tritici-repentis]EDU49369.1 predicted protein [Pyrenophora tritici-repentis Pt-1C-BFP]KAI1543473.1 hypothetical protein PtrSN001A_003052 [Pyrenophora tritici-repentis]KAI1574907.1 hypothetical protein PtrEW4_002954 [Pyrenophora tritici-repentis]KAI1583630.1 hypothetical protein PtrEW7m1_003187 [Pyrenophora tritici-repentis]